jgi:hypothetical protein
MNSVDRQHHLRLAAFHAYEGLIRPVGGLAFGDLSEGQQKALTDGIEDMAADTEVVPDDEIGRDAEDDAYDVAREDAAWGIV